MSSTNTRTESGRITGTGTLLTVTTRQGFKPRSVQLWNTDGLVTASWQETMPDDSMVLKVTLGDMTFPTSDGIIPTDTGFTIGADANLNVAAEVIHWKAQS